MGDSICGKGKFYLSGNEKERELWMSRVVKEKRKK